MSMTRFCLTSSLAVLVLAGCAFGPLMSWRAKEAAALGPDDLERLKTETYTLKFASPPPYAEVHLRTRASVSETMRIYRQRLREKGWQEDCVWEVSRECRQRKACHGAWRSRRDDATLGIRIGVAPEDPWWQLIPVRKEDIDKYTWVYVVYTPGTHTGFTKYCEG